MSLIEGLNSSFTFGILLAIVVLLMLLLARKEQKLHKKR